MPIYNWFKIFETNNLNYLVKKGDFSKDVLEKTWEIIFDEYIKTFGLNDSFKSYFDQTKKILDLKVKIALSESENAKKKLLFKLKAIIHKYESLNPTQKDSENYMTTVVAIERMLNRSINEHEMTVNKFYTYLKQIENEQVTR